MRKCFNRRANVRLQAFKGKREAPEILDLHQPVSCSVRVDEPLFAPRPDVVSFANYEPQRAFTATLSMRNQDNVCLSLLRTGSLPHHNHDRMDQFQNAHVQT